MQTGCPGEGQTNKGYATLATLSFFAAGSDQTLLPRIDDTDVNASLAIVVPVYGQRPLAVTELLDVEQHSTRHNARLLATVLDANAGVAVLQETAQHRLETELSCLLGASDRAPALAGNSGYNALKARL
ncbi:hypothetical protein [Paraburkholderia lycopersici]|uniref:Uncharacterized protein n=1 Tax=Paraburkholderia lycopersici TaxID=416944 RepID=A0A1G7D052_9BURK|nr:hypothetical protein [Paraburkholderia lycopersici]SDE44105.1 hypothetical protein SAMN05421548_14911 [Paraburkholderia lycopersici]